MPARVLVVEDEAVVAEEISEIVEAVGHDVVAKAPSAEQALVMAPAAQPDLAIVDVRLAGRMDGVELATTLRERFGLGIIFLTAYADDTTLERAKVTEPHAYLVKPFEPRELRSAISIALHMRERDRERRAEDAEREREVRELREALARWRRLGHVLTFDEKSGEVLLVDGSWTQPENVRKTADIAPPSRERSAGVPLEAKSDQGDGSAS